VAALVLVVAGGYVATRGGKPAETAKGDPVAPPGEGKAAAPAGAPEAVTPPPGSENVEDRFAWPAATRADFKLTAETDAKRGDDGIYRLAAGQAIALRLTADTDCRASVWYVDPAGVATRLFPNDDDRDDRLTAGKLRTIPGNDAYVIETTPTEGSGVDRLYVLATAGDPPAFPPGTKNGRYTAYATEAERAGLASAVRGFVLKKAGGGDAPAAEAELRFRIK
jgi:hypothetical protein